MARRRRHSRRRNGLGWLKTRRGAITFGVTATVAMVGGVYLYRRRAAAKALESGSTVTTDDGRVVVEPGAAAPVVKAKLPAEILAGGIPMDPPWHEIGWFTYPSGQFWIRIDQNSDALFKSREPSSELGLLGPKYFYNAGITGNWRWTVIAGAATPLARGEIGQGTYALRKDARLTTDYTKDSAIAAMAQATADLAAKWIDTAYSLK